VIRGDIELLQTRFDDAIIGAMHKLRNCCFSATGFKNISARNSLL
jgi:hypothetical protein